MNFQKSFFGFVTLIISVHFIMAEHMKPVVMQEIEMPTKELVKNRQGILNTNALMILTRNVKITWNFTFPENVIFKLRAKSFKFHYKPDTVCPRCCPENSLTVPDDYLHQRMYCANHLYETSIASGKNFVIIFASEFILQEVVLEFSARKKTPPCTSNSFECIDKKGCYKIKKICDGEFDCEDHSDEQNCGQCRSNYTMCNHEDQMITEHQNCFNPELHRCDGILHCKTGEDEYNCAETCANQLQCSNKDGCYTLQQRCDGKFDCKDHSDEQNCHSINCGVLSNTSDYFHCNNGWCIKKFKIYDGTLDCDDGSDEKFTPRQLKDTFALMICIYILLVMALFWMAVVQCSGMFRYLNRSESDAESVCSNSSFIYNYHPKPTKRNAASQVTIPISTSVPAISNLKPNSSISTCTTSFIYDSVGSSQESLESVATVSKIYEEIQPPFLKNTPKDYPGKTLENSDIVPINNTGVYPSCVYDKVPHNFEFWI